MGMIIFKRIFLTVNAKGKKCGRRAGSSISRNSCGFLQRSFQTAQYKPVGSSFLIGSMLRSEMKSVTLNKMLKFSLSSRSGVFFSNCCGFLQRGFQTAQYKPVGSSFLTGSMMGFGNEKCYGK
ncbi:unnamed protein product [Allacma fusca]|uniref:Uncharacterized protein n=1 Tax=Allacma fusca TaxID=39272 RepID=A0A8J2LF06_9HEXA|nr:unnamed protein product [Allacma fusca]